MKSVSPQKRKKRSARKRHTENSAGFTVFELLVAMTIAAGVMAIAALSIQNIVKRHAAEELISELHLARMTAIRQHRTVTVAFNLDTAQGAVAWMDNGGAINTKMIDLGTMGDRFLFDATPPGTPAPTAPDTAFIFSPTGLITTNPGGNQAGNIYLTNMRNNKSFHIQTTIAGSIDLNRYVQATDTWIRAH